MENWKLFPSYIFFIFCKIAKNLELSKGGSRGVSKGGILSIETPPHGIVSHPLLWYLRLPIARDYREQPKKKRARRIVWRNFHFPTVYHDIMVHISTSFFFQPLLCLTHKISFFPIFLPFSYFDGWSRRTGDKVFAQANTKHFLSSSFFSTSITSRWYKKYINFSFEGCSPPTDAPQQSAHCHSCDDDIGIIDIFFFFTPRGDAKFGESWKSFLISFRHV